MSAEFSELRRISVLINSGDEAGARNEFIRFLDSFSGQGQLQEIVDSLAVRLGLFPYLSPGVESLSASDALALAYHSPKSLSDRGFSFHKEQQRVYERLLDGQNVVLSAPTSFGKSAVIDALVLSGRWNQIVLIVPTVALIDETRRRLIGLGSDFVVYSHPQQTRGERNIYVLTQERLLELDPFPTVELFVIDEFYKLGSGESDDKRRSTLNIAWRELRRTGAQYYLLGPNVDGVEVGSNDDLNDSLIVSDFNTVVVDVEDREGVEDVDTDIQEFLLNEAIGPTLIFVSSPRKAGALATHLVGRREVDAFTQELTSWIAHNYHPEWYVTKALGQGIGTHTGPIPRSLQRAMIRLFERRSIDCMVCTSTLIEGVNTVARNMVIVDKAIDRKPIDYFTFSNIRGRAGRMLKHFVGRVISYNKPPSEEISIVEFEIETQSDVSSLSTLVQLEESELSSASKERLKPIREQRFLSLETIQRNKGLDPTRQIAVAKRMHDASSREFRRLSWGGVPNQDQLRAVLEVGYDELLAGKERRGVNVNSIMARMQSVRESAGSVSVAVDKQMEFRHSGQGVSDVVDDVLGFQRNWLGFKLPEVMRAVSRIQNEVASSRVGGVRANYEYALREIESLFLPPFIVQLEDYRLPIPVALKLTPLGLRGETLEAMLNRLVLLGTDQKVRETLSVVELWFLDDVLIGLGAVAPSVAAPS